MQVKGTVLVTRPGWPVLPSWSRIRWASNGRVLLDVVCGDTSVQSTTQSLISVPHGWPRDAGSGRFFATGRITGVIPGSTHSTHGTHQSVNFEGVDEFSASKLTASVRVNDAPTHIVAPGDGVIEVVPGRQSRFLPLPVAGFDDAGHNPRIST